MNEDRELENAFISGDYETIFDITAKNPSNQEEARIIINEYIGGDLI